MTDVQTAGAPFDICGALPEGITVLEASAGTGKTFTIAALAARYVAGGRDLSELLLLTFTRMATGELRERVRDRLVATEAALTRALAGALPADADEVVRLLAEAHPATVRARRDRLARALADFDAATITTIHSFCEEVLAELGLIGDVDEHTTFVEDPSDVLEEVVDDLYLRKFVGDERPAFKRAEALRIARAVVENPCAPLLPDREGDSLPALRRRFADAVRDEFVHRKRRMGLMTYDDLLTRLAAVLDGPNGNAAVEHLRARYGVVLVDEFQDTDPVQWRIMKRAFADGGSTLVLIGDPKQAIYSFRGADVYAYLQAARTAGTRATLNTNWRSDKGLIDAYDAVFGGARLGHEGIVYHRVEAAARNVTPRLHGAPVDAPLRVRVVHRDEPGVELTSKGYARNASAGEHIARDLAADVVKLLSSGATIEVRADDGHVVRTETVCPRHVAVLVRKNAAATLVRDALDGAGVPAVLNGAGSVFGTGSATEWLRLLEALERPAQSSRAHTAALTAFLGWSAERVADATDEDWEEVHQRLHRWARVLRLQGVAALLEAITLTERLPGRVLSVTGGERRLTDLRHVGQLLHAAAAEEHLGVTALAAWLRRRIRESDRDVGDEERSRRLESDAEAVQVLTIHRSKGLEFPIVYFPFLWEAGYGFNEAAPVVFHDADNDDERTVDVGLTGWPFKAHKGQQEVEERGEDLRLAYVALTRAKHQAVVWWAGSFDSRNSALGRLLFARAGDGTVAPKGDAVPEDGEVWDRFLELGAAAEDCVSVERSAWVGVPSWSAPLTGPVELGAAVFEREIDRRWRRTSYSDITAGAYEPSVGSEPEERAVDDEPASGSPVAAASVAADPLRDVVAASVAADPLRDVPSKLAGMPVGTRVGTFVHQVLEATDFAAGDLRAELAAQVEAALARRAVEVGERAAVVEGLAAALSTPLGPLVEGLRLCDVARGDRLDELAFELPLAGGDAARSEVRLSAIRSALRSHLGADDPLGGYADRLGDSELRQAVRGYLTGSIDLVVRLGDGRFAIADYKTNWLAAPGDPLSVWHYRPAALRAEMEHGHYGLQALLYTVALHRYLRWRLPGYSADRHLAGVLYLFVRGMLGPETPEVGGTPCGVWSWQPSAALVEALSDVLDGGGAA